MTPKGVPANTPVPAKAAQLAPTAPDAIKALISALGHKGDEIASIEITQKAVRVLFKDRSLRSHRIEWRKDAG